MADTSGLSPAQLLLAKHNESDSKHSEPSSSQHNGSSSLSPSLSEFSAGGSGVSLNKNAPPLTQLGWGSGKSAAAIAASGVSNGSSRPQSADSSRNVAPARSDAVTDVFTMDGAAQQPRAKNAVGELVARIKKETGTQIDSSTSRATGGTTFVIRGKADAVYKARREVIRGLSIKVSEVVPVPASALPFIIGSKGRNLQTLEQKCKTRIHVDKKKEELEAAGVSPDDEENLVDIIVEGDIEGVSETKNEINSIVAERVKNLTSRIRVEDAFLPFIIGFEGSRIPALEEAHSVKIRVADDKNGKTDNLVSIIISGDRDSVVLVKQELEDKAKSIGSTLKEAAVSIPKAQHKVLTLDNKAGIAKIFEETGCILKVPPSSDPSTEIVVVGPPRGVGQAISLAIEGANSVIVDSLDISRAYKSRNHARDITRYFLKSGKIDEIEKNNQVQISVPVPSDLFDSSAAQGVVYEIAGRNSDHVKAARRAVIDVVNAFPLYKITQVGGIDPIFFPLISAEGSKVQKSLKENFVYLLLPDKTEPTEDIVLVYQGNPDEEFVPGQEDVQEALDNVIFTLSEFQEATKNLSSRLIDLPFTNHKYLVGPRGSATLDEITGGPDARVHVQFGVSGLSSGDIPKGLTQDKVLVRGPAEEVDRVADGIIQAIEHAKEQEVLSNYTTECKYPMRFLSILIGKSGSNIAKLRDESGCKIDIDEQEGLVKVKGIKTHADKVRGQIFELGHRLEDEVLLRIAVPNQYHGVIIGQKGKFVQRLEDKYHCRILFPRAGGADSGVTTHSDDPTSLDEVVIRGPKKEAAKAKDEILELLKYEQEHNHSEDIEVPSNVLSRVIGRNGELINSIKESSGARIDIERKAATPDPDSLPSPATGSVKISLRGTVKSIKDAKKQIMDTVHQIESIVTEQIPVDHQYYKAIIGPGGGTLRNIAAKAGVKDNTARFIRIPSPDSGDDKIVIHGDKKAVAKAISEIKKIVAEQESLANEIVPVAPSKYRVLIGTGGSTRRLLEKEFNVTLNVPRGGNSEGVTITGKPEDVEKAKERIVELTKDDFVATVNVPRRLHQEVSDHGGLVRRLRNEYNVSVSHGGANVPTSRRPQKTEPVARIDDEAILAEKGYTWTVVPDEPVASDDKEESYIAWNLSGDPKQCEKAAQLIKQEMKDAEDTKFTAYMSLADPKKYRFVVGPKGSRINLIRDESHSRITVPQPGSGSKYITIRGSEKGIEVARDLVLDSIKGPSRVRNGDAQDDGY